MNSKQKNNSIKSSNAQRIKQKLSSVAVNQSEAKPSKQKKKVVVIALTLALMLSFFFVGLFFTNMLSNGLPVEVGSVVYTESLNTVNNPERGRSFSNGGQLTNTRVQNFWSAETIKSDKEKYGVGYVGLRFGLEEFSNNGPVAVENGSLNGVSGDVVTKSGTDQLIGEVALSNLKQLLFNCRSAGQVAVVAFSYNVWGKGALRVNENGDVVSGYVHAEPDAGISLVVSHIEQLSEVITEYSDVVFAIETRMLGPWGEQHSTPMAHDLQNYHIITEAWLNNTPQTISVLLRRPSYYLEWFNREYNTNIKESSITDTIEITERVGGNAKRVGIYNDGYLGSNSDLGTFHENNREEVNNWLSYQTKYTIYGGEFSGNIPGISEDSIHHVYHEMDHVEKESFLTHVTYINGTSQSNYGPMAEWKANTYYGSDPHYYGKTDEHTYYDNHLGYRWVLRDFDSALSWGKMEISFDIENVGFGNLVKDKIVQIILVKGTEQFVYDTQIDFTELFSDQTKTYSVKLSPKAKSFEKGEYTVYLKVFEKSLGAGETIAIKLANAKDLYNSKLYANQIGRFVIK